MRVRVQRGVAAGCFGDVKGKGSFFWWTSLSIWQWGKLVGRRGEGREKDSRLERYKAVKAKQRKIYKGVMLFTKRENAS